MTDITHSSEPLASGWRTFFENVRVFLRSFGNAVTISTGYESRFREVQHLQSLTDADLATKGIARDRIVHHVFRDIYDL